VKRDRLKVKPEVESLAAVSQRYGDKMELLDPGQRIAATHGPLDCERFAARAAAAGANGARRTVTALI
jgi:hypothetical protein